MSINLENIAKIRVIGVGGGGNNATHAMIKEGIKGAKFIVANTDEQTLTNSQADVILPLGKTAKGLGAGAKPDEGRRAAIESEEEIRKVIDGADMVIIAAGMGGGTGTGAAPIIAKIAKESGALVVGIVTTPFTFEGKMRKANAEEGLKNLEPLVDSLIIVSNDKLLKQFGGISLKDSFMYADKILKQSVKTITELISVPALINLDFADVKTVMKDKGKALIGIGRASGADRAKKAALHAISSPILETSIHGATNAIINISGSDVTLDEANEAVETIQSQTKSDVNVIFGVAIDDSLQKDLQVSVIATGLSGTTSHQIDGQIFPGSANAAPRSSVSYDWNGSSNPSSEDRVPAGEQLDRAPGTENGNQHSPFDVLDDEEDELPAFLKR